MMTISGLFFLCQSLGLQKSINMRDDNFNFFEVNTVKKQSNEKIHKNKNVGKIDDCVYDIELKTHDFNCGFPLIVHNTDSF